MVVGASTKHNQLAMEYLENALLILFPICVVFIFVIARLIAATSTKPVSSIISTAKQISKDNLSLRVPLPSNKDELYTLSITINSLLDRLESQILQAKQFSSDASHELRTPLSVIKGSLEILIRKPRTPEQYHHKIDYILQQTSRLERLVDQFLLISRVDNHSLELQKSYFSLKDVLLRSQQRFEVFLNEKNIEVDLQGVEDKYLDNYKDLVDVIVDNLFSNSIKYSNYNAKIKVSSYWQDQKYLLCFSDNGIGMSQQELRWAQQRFYRSNNYDLSQNVSGSGLGLHIVTQLSRVCGFTLEIQSQKDQGTQIYLSLEPVSH